jgi:hypothetical protein
VLDFPVLGPCLFSSLLDCQFKNVCGHRETRRTGSARQSFDLPRDALRFRSRVLPPKFYFTCHDTYSRTRPTQFTQFTPNELTGQTLTVRALRIASCRLPISIPGSEAAVIEHFQECLPYGRYVPDVRRWMRRQYRCRVMSQFDCGNG